MPPKPGTAAQGAYPEPQPVPQEGTATILPLAEGESGKLVRLGITRSEDFLYYVAKGDVWATPKKRPGKPGGKPFIVAKVGFTMDFERYLYYLDGDGDVARQNRRIGGAR